MFEKLVESAKEKRGRRARRLFLATVAVYAVALTAIGVVTVIGFHPALAGGDEVLSILIPPPVPSGPDPSPVQIKPNPKSAPDQGFVAPIKTIYHPNVDDLNLGPIRPILVPGGNPAEIGREGVIPGAPISKDPPPPPPPTPTPVVKPAAPPAQDAVVRLTSMLTQGRVLRKVQPPYPVIAKQAGIEGSVQVQIDISEDGAVTNVTLLSGHPLLRDAALRAAKQWQFIPTELNGHRVRAIGMITFNFTLH
jgi:TonB family protein